MEETLREILKMMQHVQNLKEQIQDIEFEMQNLKASIPSHAVPEKQKLIVKFEGKFFCLKLRDYDGDEEL